jgi:hypothetical protein
MTFRTLDDVAAGDPVRAAEDADERAVAVG